MQNQRNKWSKTCQLACTRESPNAMNRILAANAKKRRKLPQYEGNPRDITQEYKLDKNRKK